MGRRPWLPGCDWVRPGCGEADGNCPVLAAWDCDRPRGDGLGAGRDGMALYERALLEGTLLTKGGGTGPAAPTYGLAVGGRQGSTLCEPPAAGEVTCIPAESQGAACGAVASDAADAPYPLSCDAAVSFREPSREAAGDKETNGVALLPPMPSRKLALCNKSGTEDHVAVPCGTLCEPPSDDTKELPPAYWYDKPLMPLANLAEPPCGEAIPAPMAYLPEPTGDGCTLACQSALAGASQLMVELVLPPPVCAFHRPSGWPEASKPAAVTTCKFLAPADEDRRLAPKGSGTGLIVL
mmetsp:Transcript_16501/g.30052  ORF Transcript_16501/g.30052 Transcript_16501/m.30052 type:complete len:295 (-) Transcript_16501:277-1161(-)